MSNMTIKQIETAIKSYIDENFPGEYRYALMLNGSWGSGKTYFIQNNIIRDYNKDYHNDRKHIKAVYVSLNGLKDKNEIASSIMSSVASAKSGKAVLWAVGIAVGLLSDLAGTYIGAKTSENVEETLKLTSFSENEFFFVFDDLERCLMPLEESLGYISSFVEQYKAKVIILANEEEIKNGFAQRLDYYQLAANKDLKINLDASEKEKGDLKNHDNRIDILDLSRRAEKVSEALGTYERIKEKVVGKTIEFKLSLQERVENILRFSTPAYISDVAVAAEVVKLMEDGQHLNLRTLMFAAQVFNKFTPYTHDYEEREEYIVFMQQLFYVILRVSIRCKSGKEDVSWKPYEKSKFVQFGRNKFSEFLSLKAVHDEVYYGLFTPEEVEESILIFYDFVYEVFIKEHTGPLKVLGNLRVLNDEDVEQIISEIYVRLRSSYYHVAVYDVILGYLCFLYCIGFESANPEICFSIMKQFIEEKKIREIYCGEELFHTDPGYDLYCSYANRLKAVCKEVVAEDKKIISGIIEKEVTGKPGWWSSLCNVLDQKIQEGYEYTCEFDYGTIEQWHSAIMCSDSQELCALMRRYESVKDRMADPDRAKELAQKLKKSLEGSPLGFDKIRKYNIKCLIDQLEGNVQ